MNYLPRELSALFFSNEIGVQIGENEPTHDGHFALLRKIFSMKKRRKRSLSRRGNRDLFPLRKESKSLLKDVNSARKFRREGVNNNFTKYYGEVLAEIEENLRSVVHPMEDLYSLKQAAELLHVSIGKVRILVKEGILELTPTGYIPARSVAKYQNEEKRYRRKQYRDSLIGIINEITKYREQMLFDFDGKEWLPISGTSNAAVYWSKVSILFIDLSKYPERLKECINCNSLFWDSSINKIAKYCEDPDCKKDQQIKNFSRFKQGDSKKRKPYKKRKQKTVARKRE